MRHRYRLTGCGEKGKQASDSVEARNSPAIDSCDSSGARVEVYRNTESKRCGRCTVHRPLTEFGLLQKDGRVWHRSVCKQCRAYTAKWKREELKGIVGALAVSPNALCVCGRPKASHPSTDCPGFFELGI